MHKLVVVFLLAIAGCASAGRSRSVEWSHTSSAPLPPELERVLRDYERAWIAWDADALASLFTEEGHVLSNGRPPVCGRDAIRASYQGAGGPLWLRPLAAAAEGNTGYIVGVYGHDPAQPESGKFVLALRRFTTGWMIDADIDNSIDPPQENRRP